ncbi:MAG: DUF2336 domain-containing protein [Alphaproteobacteria bacterium]
MARDRSPAGRSALVAALGDAFVDESSFATDRERELVNDILRRLVSDVEAAVRRVLAERLAERSDAPRGLVMMLANDDADVAYPILTRSNVLQDPDLITIARQRTVRHRIAIAARSPLSEGVSAALAEAGEETVITALLDNKQARILPETFRSIVELSRTNDTLHEPLLDRQDLPVNLVKKMYWWVSAALRHHILDQFDIDPATLDDAVEESVAKLLPNGSKADASAPLHLKQAAERLIRTKGVTPTLLSDLLRTKQTALFEVLLARQSNLRLTFLRRLLYQPGGEALTITLRAIGIEKPDFASIFLWSRQARRGDKSVDPMELQRVLTLFDRIQPQTAQAILRRWQRDPDYLKAIRMLESEGLVSTARH